MKDRVVLRLPVGLAPLQIMVFPLMAKDGLPEIASEVVAYLSEQGLDVEYDDSGTIGRRYARADEIGVPLTVTVDYQTKTDQTVTIRDRDTWQQVRNKWQSITEVARSFLFASSAFDALGTPIKAEYE